MSTVVHPGSAGAAAPGDGEGSAPAHAEPSRRRGHPLVRYALRRALAGLVLLFALSIVVFAAMALLPGDVPTTILGKNATPGQVAALVERFHLDDPLPQRYVDWLSGFVTGDLGTSLANEQPVGQLLASRGWNTVQFALLAIAIVVPLAIAIGVLAAVRAGGVLDHVIGGVSLLGISFPDFIVATLVAWVFGIWLGLFPPVALLPPGASPLDDPEILVLPVLAMIVIAAPYTSRMVRAGMIDVLASDYIQTARLLGVRERQVIVRHALPNALAPTVQTVATTLVWLLGGVVAVEIVFNYPGIGAELVRSVQIRDINFVQSTALVLAAVFIAINVVADILVVLLVPRLRTSL